MLPPPPMEKSGARWWPRALAWQKAESGKDVPRPPRRAAAAPGMMTGVPPTEGCSVALWWVGRPSPVPDLLELPGSWATKCP